MSITSAANSALYKVNSIVACLLDKIAIRAHWVLPIQGAWVGYTPGKPFIAETWIEGSSRLFQFGGFEACVDL
jgi:hypothetical protein